MVFCVLHIKTPRKTVEFGLFCPFGILVIQGYVMGMMEESVAILTQCFCHSLGFSCCNGSVASFRNSSVAMNSNPRSRQGRRCLIIQVSPATESSSKLSLRQRSLCVQLPALVRGVLQSTSAAHIKAVGQEHKLAVQQGHWRGFGILSTLQWEFSERVIRYSSLVKRKQNQTPFLSLVMLQRIFPLFL